LLQFLLCFADFDFGDWMKFREFDLGSFSNHGTQYLMQELGIGSMLYKPMCNLHDKIYGADQLQEGMIDI
jgi:hypothetical protein